MLQYDNILYVENYKKWGADLKSLNNSLNRWQTLIWSTRYQVDFLFKLNTKFHNLIQHEVHVLKLLELLQQNWYSDDQEG